MFKFFTFIVYILIQGENKTWRQIYTLLELKVSFEVSVTLLLTNVVFAWMPNSVSSMWICLEVQGLHLQEYPWGQLALKVSDVVASTSILVVNFCLALWVQSWGREGCRTGTSLRAFHFYRLNRQPSVAKWNNIFSSKLGQLRGMIICIKFTIFYPVTHICKYHKNLLNWSKATNQLVKMEWWINFWSDQSRVSQISGLSN